LPGQQDLDDTQRRAAQREGVFGAGRFLVDGEDPANVSSLSASATATVTGAVGTSSPCPTGL
jgi:TPP-dependent pyruvate/acetoin dehydrogenase alpha subunit